MSFCKSHSAECYLRFHSDGGHSVEYHYIACHSVKVILLNVILGFILMGSFCWISLHRLSFCKSHSAECYLRCYSDGGNSVEYHYIACDSVKLFCCMLSWVSFWWGHSVEYHYIACHSVKVILLNAILGFILMGSFCWISLNCISFCKNLSAECYPAKTILLNVIHLSVFLLSVILPNDILLPYSWMSFRFFTSRHSA